MKLNNNDDSHNSGLNLLIYNMLLDIESHPAWVCGLKHLVSALFSAIMEVTPCVGVWIETVFLYSRLLVWIVTPCVGVWIETLEPLLHSCHQALVTPCVGVWIETCWELLCGHYMPVTPCVGVWIETAMPKSALFSPCHTLRGCVD